MLSIDLFYADDDADDIEIFSDAVKMVQKEKDITLHSFNTGAALLKKIRKLQPSYPIIFLDINMPLKNGYEVLKEIREDPVFCDTPVIMYSTSSNLESVNTSRELGAHFYAIKPSDFHLLVKIIDFVTGIDWKQYHSIKSNFLIGKNF